MTVTVDCDPPDMMLLARKGDTRYWSANNWSQHYEDRQLWSVDITRRMLEEGFVATDKSWGSIKKLTGIRRRRDTHSDDGCVGPARTGVA